MKKSKKFVPYKEDGKYTPKEMQQMLNNIDLKEFWRKVMIKVCEEADAFDRSQQQMRFRNPERL
jgi:hypothetical protein